MSEDTSVPGRDIVQEKINELESAGLQVDTTRHSGGGQKDRFYCRLRNRSVDLTFFGDTREAAIDKALDHHRRQAGS